MRQTQGRAQSEVIGIVLLVGVVTVLVLGAGSVVLSNLVQSDDRPLATIESSATATNVTIEMRGGDRFSAADVAVIVRNGTETRLGLAAEFRQISGADNGTLEPGDRWRDRSYTPPSGEFRLLVVDTDSGTVLHERAFPR